LATRARTSSIIMIWLWPDSLTLATLCRGEARTSSRPPHRAPVCRIQPLYVQLLWEAGSCGEAAVECGEVIKWGGRMCGGLPALCCTHTFDRRPLSARSSLPRGAARRRGPAQVAPRCRVCAQLGIVPGARGKGITSRMLPMPVQYVTRRSKPTPKPACF